MRPMFGSFGGARGRTSLSFVSQASLLQGSVQGYELRKQIAAVKGVRSITKKQMVHNAWLPVMEIDAQTYSVRADGQLLTCEPATVLPMAQKYFLF
jgi:urease subunit alpha